MAQNEMRWGTALAIFGVVIGIVVGLFLSSIIVRPVPETTKAFKPPTIDVDLGLPGIAVGKHYIIHYWPTGRVGDLEEIEIMEIGRQGDSVKIAKVRFNTVAIFSEEWWEMKRFQKAIVEEAK